MNLLIWLKKVWYVWLWLEEYKKTKRKNIINNIEKFLAFHSLFFDYITVTVNNWTSKEVLIYSKDKFVLWLFKDYSAIGPKYSKEVFIELGKLLWYPQCCINSFISEIDKGSAIEKYIKKLSMESHKPSFYLNNIFFSSSKSYPQLFYDVSNVFIFSDSLSFITYHPCSYNCNESLRRIKIFEKFLWLKDPEYLKILKTKTRVNYVYFNQENWLAFRFNLTWNNLIKVFDWVLKKSELVKTFKPNYYLSVSDSRLKIFNWNFSKEFAIWNDVQIINFM